jgi:membrane associated rhomboid family serine protease
MVIPIRVSQPSYSRPVVTVGLIVVNILVFLYERSLDPYSLNEFIGIYGLRPYDFHFANVFTSIFLHGGWLHVAGNMLFLWVFGDNVEDILGHGKFLVFYLVCGVAAALAQTAMDPVSRIPMVGASGAIAGVMGAYLVKFPHSRVDMLAWLLFIFRFDLPAWFMLAYWFGLQLLGGFGSISITQSSVGGVAFLAHVGGFVAGALLIYVMGARKRFSRRRDLYW